MAWPDEVVEEENLMIAPQARRVKKTITIKCFSPVT